MPSTHFSSSPVTPPTEAVPHSLTALFLSSPAPPPRLPSGLGLAGFHSTGIPKTSHPSPSSPPPHPTPSPATRPSTPFTAPAQQLRSTTAPSALRAPHHLSAAPPPPPRPTPSPSVSVRHFTIKVATSAPPAPPWPMASCLATLLVAAHAVAPSSPALPRCPPSSRISLLTSVAFCSTCPPSTASSRLALAMVSAYALQYPPRVPSHPGSWRPPTWQQPGNPAQHGTAAGSSRQPTRRAAHPAQDPATRQSGLVYC